MILYVFSVRDRAANVFGQPFFGLSTGAAIRGFGDEINRKAENNQLNKHPADFDLYILGEYDDSRGVFNTSDPRQIAVGKDLYQNVED